MSKEFEYSKYQKEIFEDAANGNHHTVVKARAGAAKTTSLVEAIKHVPEGKHTLFCAFNKRIVEELKTKEIPWTAEVKTLHSQGFRAIIGTYGKQKVDPKRVGGILGKIFTGRTGNTFELRLRLEKAVSLSKAALANTVEEIDQVIDQFGIDTIGADKNGFEEQDRSAFITYVQQVLEICKDVKGSVDFDDMVWLPVVHRKKIAVDKYDRVFVDETQDLSPAQIELSIMSCNRKGRICAVGDPAQSIYSWRGAEVNSIDNIIERFDARVLSLPICYRCPTSVVELAKIIVPDIEPAPNAPKGLVLEVSEIEMTKSANPGDVILSRFNAPLLGLCFNFLADGRKAMIQGRDIGSNLSSFIKKSNCATIIELMQYTDAWRQRESDRLLQRENPRVREAEAVEDKANCIHVLSQNAKTVQDVLATIDNLFADVTNENAVVLSSVHKYKGLEADRVYVLLRSLRVRRENWGMQVADPRLQEELNIIYVALTRARKELYLVND